uniref:furin n=1 Tax=Hirondellea gigas TaxID=1518452 RepID=A0A2P2I154_9CRUS
MVWTLSVPVMFLVFFASCILCVCSHDVPALVIYHNQFAVHVPDGLEAANDIAHKYGFNNIGQIGDLDNFFLYEHHHVHKRSVEPSHHHHRTLFDDPQVVWVEQQVEKKRVKRVDPLYPTVDIIPADVTPKVSPRWPRQLFDITPFRGFNIFGTSITPPDRERKQLRFPDPLYRLQWYLEKGASGGYDMNVLPAWQKGYTGKGVVISILDDGIQHNHPDLAQNYDPLASTDINDNDPDPMPRDNGDNRHGTRCAGEVAAVAFNHYCGVGVAYNASIGGVRMLDGTVNDAVEARAIGLNPNHIDIYSASWGPEDDGKTVDGPGPLAKRAFINGVIRGRHGKGSIFVWASGNGGRHTDNCNCDGYTNSIFTLSISSASQRGFKPWYLEECSSTLTSTYSSGTPGLDHSVATVDMDGSLRPDHVCTVEHTGTSASAPIAAGIVALALEANPDLTWRDLQHLVVRASSMAPLMHEDGWFANGVGRKVSHKFGYGLIDAGEMVNLAERWTTVPPQHVCQTSVNSARLTIATVHGAAVSSEITTGGCAGTSGEVRYLEHVQAKVSLRFAPRGNINIKLRSPSGTVSTLLFERPRDILSEKFDEWPFLSVHFWGERAVGTWQLVVTNSGSRPAHQPGVLVQWQLVLHGTKEHPEKLRTSASSFSHTRPSFAPIPTIRFSSPFRDQVGSGSIRSELQVPVQEVQETMEDDKQKGRQRGGSRRPFLIRNDTRDTGFSAASGVCHSECSGGCYAPGPSNCRTCKHFRLQGECLSNCPDGTYSDDSHSCQPCHESCAQCLGPQQTQCRACHASTLFVTHLGLCVEQCPLAYYSSNGTCKRCGGQCSECEAVGQCTQCDHNLLLLNGTCYTTCPHSYYETQDNKCSKCSEPCASCVGEGIHQCASCITGLYLTRGKCVSRCPIGTYSDITVKSCVACRAGCSSCTSSDACNSCKKGWRSKAGACVSHKPDRCQITEYLNTSNARCELCHESCSSCTGGQDTECLHCAAPSFLFISTCLHVCPPGYYGRGGRCLQCPDSCTSCSSYTSCNSCAPRFVLHNRQCVPACPEKTYRDRSTCLDCYQSCATCWGGGNSQCATCPQGHQLLGSQCYTSCPDGYYAQGDECRPCYHNCNTCSSSGLASCLSCRDGLTLDGGLCLECGSGQYFNASLLSCQRCDDACLTCAGHHASCTSCQSPLSLHLSSATCRPCCSSIRNSIDTALCCDCDPNTDQCYGSASADKRRIALSPQAEAERATASTGHFFSSVTSVTIAVGLVNAILFSALFCVIYMRSSKSRCWDRRLRRGSVKSSNGGASSSNSSSGSSGHYYRRLPVRLSSSQSSSLLLTSLEQCQDSDGEDSEENHLLHTRT